MRSRLDASPKPRRPVASTPKPGHLVTLVHAAGCHLCESARRVIEGVRAEIPFELEEVDITGDEELEPRYRERIPVVLIDGEEAFTYFVTPAGLRRRVEP
jgi:glutaredoxin